MTSKRLNMVLLAAALLCTAFLLSACNKNKNKKFIDQETYDLMKQTQSELTACSERCRDAARGGYAFADLNTDGIMKDDQIRIALRAIRADLF